MDKDRLRSAHDEAARRDERWLGRFRSAGGRMLGLSMTAALVSAAMTILQAWALARIIAGAVIQGKGISDLTFEIILFLATIPLRALCDMGRQGLAFEAGARIRQSMRTALLNKIAASSPVEMAARPSGEVASILSEGVEAVQDYFAAFLPQRMIAALIPILILVVVFPFDWISGIILLITAPLIPLFMIVVGKGAESLNRKQFRRLILMGAHLFDRIAGLVTLRQMGAAKREAALVAAMSEGYRTATMKVLRIAFLSSLVLEFFATIAVALVAVYIGFRLYYGELAFLPGLFALLIAPEFYRPLRDMGQHYHARMSAIGAAEGLISILGDTAADTVADAPVETPATVSLPANAPQSIRFENVGYVHAEGAALTDISFELNRGDTVAIMGPSGTGKTTLVRMLLGLLPAIEGQILIDGQPLSSIAERDWQSRIGWLPQSPTLFAGTIADNISLGHPDATAEDIRDAARKAMAHEFIEALPDGYDTRLGESGSGISGGQIRRVALARALLARPALLVLDEPTAALDHETADAMLNSVLSHSSEAIRLIVTHDADCAAMADRVITMDQGRIVETTGAVAPKEAEDE